MEHMEATGNCFEDCLHFMLGLPSFEIIDVVMVHGIVKGNVPGCEGKRIAHAWIECSEGIVIDPNAGVVPKKDYYRIGEIDPEYCKRYTKKDTTQMMIIYGHCGYWELDETMIEVGDLNDPIYN